MKIPIYFTAILFSYILFRNTGISQNDMQNKHKKEFKISSLNPDKDLDFNKIKDSVILVTDSFELFTRQTNKKPIYAGNGDSINNELWIRYNKSKKEELLVECRDNEDTKKLIVDIFAAVRSDDKQKIYFMCNAWATSAAIHEVILRTKEERFICDGNYLEVIKKGKYKGKLIVSQHRYLSGMNMGSYDYFYIVDDNGKVLKKLGEEIPMKY